MLLPTWNARTGPEIGILALSDLWCVDVARTGPEISILALSDLWCVDVARTGPEIGILALSDLWCVDVARTGPVIGILALSDLWCVDVSNLGSPGYHVSWKLAEEGPGWLFSGTPKATGVHAVGNECESASDV